jgi:hypothetical protein
MPSDIVDALSEAILKASEAELRATGLCPRPQVHILAEDMDRPYLGYLVCRDFYRGTDAASAIAALGLLPSVLAATRLLVVWEDRDLRTALELPPGSSTNAIVLLDAHFDRHTLRWHPFDVAVSGTDRHGRPTISLTWRAPARYENVALLEPISALLEVWRELRTDDLQKTAIELQRAGYELNWATPIGDSPS